VIQRRAANSQKEPDFMPFYENVFIARQDISSAQAEALTEQFSNLIAEQGGKVTKKEPWGLRNIAYRIKKNRKGHYVLLNIEAPAAAVIEMERQMRINEDVLRYLTVRVDALEEGPSAMLQSRSREGDRDDRGPRRGFGGGGGFRGDREGGGYRGDREDRPRRDYGDRPRHEAAPGAAVETPAEPRPTPAPEGDAS
jgi:small subunit ribosomal protein S6